MLTGGVGGKFGNGAQRTQRKNSKIYQGQPIEHFNSKKNFKQYSVCWSFGKNNIFTVWTVYLSSWDVLVGVQ